MLPVRTIGLDISKRVFQLHAVDSKGKPVLRRKLSHSQMIEILTDLNPCLIGIEATAGANYLARELRGLGHDARLMASSFVRPYVKTNKNDANDAEAICEAVRRPNMRFVAVKTPEQQAMLTLHRTRALLARHKVATTNAIKAFLTEFGILVGSRAFGTAEAVKLVDTAPDSKLPEFARIALGELVTHFRAIEARLKACRALIDRWHKQNPACVRLATIPGLSTLASTALVATIDDGKCFRSGRQFAAWIGLVPRQWSTGGRQVLGRISKRGDAYLRKLFIMGAMSTMRAGAKSKHRIVHWALRLAERKRYFLAVVALANKLARIAWAVLVRGKEFREQALPS